MNQVAVVIAPHPDDEVLGCGGVIAHLANSGNAVHVLIVTKGAPDMFPESYVLNTRAELAKAHTILGIRTVTYLDFPSAKLDTVPAYVLADEIRRHLIRLEADTVFLPYRGDIHQDHRACYWATLVACRPQSDRKSARLLCYETLSETEWGAPEGSETFVPNVFVDISATLNQKLDAMACYQSQLKTPPHSRSLETLEALARVRGAAAGLPAAEAFMLIRDVWLAHARD